MSMLRPDLAIIAENVAPSSVMRVGEAPKDSA